jgi:hypothetical protein
MLKATAKQVDRIKAFRGVYTLRIFLWVQTNGR